MSPDEILASYTDGALLQAAVRSAGTSRLNVLPRWAHVGRVFVVGSTVAKALCRRYGIDPDEMIGCDPIDSDGYCETCGQEVEGEDD